MDSYTRLLDRVEKYAEAYGGLRAAVQLFIDGKVDREFLALMAEKTDKKLGLSDGAQ